MTHGKNVTTGPASTPRFDKLLTGEHAGPACYVTVPPSVSPPSDVEHNIAISDSCDTFSKTTTQATLMSNKSPTTTSPRVDECITVEEVPARRAAGCASEHTAHAAGQVAWALYEHVFRVTNNMGVARSVILSETWATIAFVAEARFDKPSMALNGDVRVQRHVDTRTIKMVQACLHGVPAGVPRAPALEVRRILGGGLALALSQSPSPLRMHVCGDRAYVPTGRRVRACGAAGLQGLLVSVARVMVREDREGGRLGGSPALALSSSLSSPRMHVCGDRECVPRGGRVMAGRAAGLQGLLVGVVRVMARADLHGGGAYGGKPLFGTPIITLFPRLARYFGI